MKPYSARKAWRFLTASLPLLVSILSVCAQGPHLTMGNPSSATNDTSQKDNFLMEKAYFALSYNNSKATPNWVSWKLTVAEIGDAPRFGFHPDEDLRDVNAGFTVVEPKDYTGGGFD